jgi:hypothetical protein
MKTTDNNDVSFLFLKNTIPKRMIFENLNSFLQTEANSHLFYSFRQQKQAFYELLNIMGIGAENVRNDNHPKRFRLAQSRGHYWKSDTPALPRLQLCAPKNRQHGVFLATSGLPELWFQVPSRLNGGCVMAESQVIDMVVSEAEATSISEVASKIVNETKSFADKWNVPIPFDLQKIEEDLIIFLTKRKQTKLTKLRVTVLEDGNVEFGDTIHGQRRADLIFQIIYKPQGSPRIK